MVSVCHQNFIRSVTYIFGESCRKSMAIARQIHKKFMSYTGKDLGSR